MLNENQGNHDKVSEAAEKLFDAFFGELLNDKPKEELTVEPPVEELDDIFGTDELPVGPLDDWAAATSEYIPESIGDEEWEAFVSRTPIPPMDREQEARAVSVGLQELRKTKEYMNYIYRHMTQEFKTIYVTYPLLFDKYFEEVFGKAHKEISALVEDMEHLIAGDIDKVEAVKTDYRLSQSFSERRSSILYDILAFYNKK